MLLVVCSLLASCEAKPKLATEPVAPAGSAAATPPAPTAGSAPAAPATAAAAAGASAQLPLGLRALKASDSLPKLSSGELLLLAGKPGDKVVLTGADGKRLEVVEGLIGKVTGDARELPDGWKYEESDVAELAEASGDQPHTAQVVTRALEQGDFSHAQVWFVPTVGTRTQLAEDATTISVDWSDPKGRWAVVILNETASLADVKTGTVTQLAEHAGSPSYAPDGTLHYRTLDGGAWRWADNRATKIGKGKCGKPSHGDLNEGFEPAQYPPAVTFDATGKPSFK